MKFSIAPLLEKVRAWFPKARETLQAHADELEAKFNPQELHPIPRQQSDRLKRELAGLATPEPYQKFIRSELEERLEAWRSGVETGNSLAVLGCPAEAIATILWDTLTSPEPVEDLTLQWLPWSSRPRDYRAIAEELEKTILPPAEGDRVLAVIPDLSWCFLRCTDGFDGIDRLKEAIFHDRSRFWLVGCNRWAWLYLDRVCQLGDLFENTISLPPLIPIALKEWIEPVRAPLDLQLGEEESAEEEEELEEEKWASQAERRYYHRLAGVSQGVGAIAARGWLESLGISPPKTEEEESENSEEPEPSENPEESETEPPPWILGRPTLPTLPSLSKEDRFLLFSLAVHGAMTLPHLAMSLGISEGEIHTQVQRLIRVGAVIRPPTAEGQLQLNPMHYPRLKRDLDNNKFLIGEES
ncbi:MarR family transcriptional regulator [Lyngbya sp. CCY1209]|uniref:MarR family transcriptional regulator n=1 Tax=Lyngbya sp. CCY1209 TaxID=2886103 RepID=UPI002D216B2B|nr:MarR family transcriptional regulator [Lyngbya sp. CCY1209]MEB3886835.1 MarR family transcriptional regulator [Lyngbya sp. CCY1209]